MEIQEKSEILTNRLKGNIFENLVVANFQKMNEHRYQHRHYYFWQDHNGLEVDLLLKTAEAFDAYEIKATQTLTTDLFKGLQHFAEIAKPAAVHTHLVYGGQQSLVRSNTDVLGWKDGG